MDTKTTPAHHQTRIRLLVADDRPIVRQGIIIIVQLQRDMTIVAEAGDGLEAIRLIKEHLPDIVLLDLRMPRMDGLDVLAELQAAKLPSKVIVMTTFDSENDVRCSIKAGARESYRTSRRHEFSPAGECPQRNHGGDSFLRYSGRKPRMERKTIAAFIIKMCVRIRITPTRQPNPRRASVPQIPKCSNTDNR